MADLATAAVTPAQQSLATNANIPAGQAGSPWSNTITSQQLQPTTPVTLPAPPPPSNAPAALVAGVNATTPSLQDYINNLTPAQTPADQQQQAILDSLSSLTGQDTGKTAYQNQQEEAAGVPALQQQLSDLNGQITTGNAAYKALTDTENSNLSAAGAIGGNVESNAVLQAQQSGITKAAEAQKASAAADLGMKAAQAQALTGNINTAITIATNATNAKYEPIEDDIKVQQAQLAAIQPMLDEEQKTQAVAQQQVLKDQADAVTQQKADETQKQTIAMQAAGNGAPQGIIAAITNATDPNVALQLATPYLANAKTQIVEVNGHSLLIDSQTGKTVQDLGVSNAVIQANIAHGGAGGGVSSIVDPATDAGVKAIIAANPGEWGHAADAIDAKYGAGTATQYDAQLKAVYQNGQDVNTAFGASGPALKLTATQIGVVNKANAAVNNSKTGIAFQNATNAFNAIQSINPNTTNPAEQQQALLNLAQLEFPGTNSARGLLTVNPADSQNSSFTNGLIKAQQLLQAKGGLGSGVLSGLQAQAKTLYSTIQSSYNSNFNANVTSVAKTLGISQAQAKQYLTNYNSNVGTTPNSSTSQTTTKSGQPFDYQGAIKAGYTDAQIQTYLNAN